MKRYFWLAVLIIVVIGWPSAAIAAGEGVISGRLVNKTPGGHSVERIEVSLLTYAGENLASEQKMLTDELGNFAFQGLSVGPSNSYQIKVKFQEALYVSEKVFVDAQMPYQKVELTVYDSTTNDQAVGVSNAHLIVYAGAGDLEVMEVWRFTNAGDQTYIGKEEDGVRKTVKFVLPEGATSVSSGDGFVFDSASRTMADTLALLPGVFDIGISYILPNNGPRTDLTRTLDYSVPKFRLLVQDTGVAVSSGTMTRGETLDMGGSKYISFAADNLAKGKAVDVSFSGLTRPATGKQGSTNFPWAWLVSGIAALGLVTTLAFPRLTRRRALATGPAGTTGPRSNGPQTDKDLTQIGLLEELANLDDTYEAGTITESYYQAHRARIKARLVESYRRASTTEQ